MKKLLLCFLACTFLIACKQGKKLEKKENKDSIAPISDEVLEHSVIYEANIRQYSPQGSFNAFTKDIPQLKNLGVKIIWLMPIYPISQIKKKTEDGQFAEEIKDSTERAKVLGSYYAVSDFTKVNPEFGNKEDFRKLLRTAHKNGMYVILDWVPNHTGWDHVWIKEHPDYYTHNNKGEIIDPINPETGKSWGWDDVADLNYNNQAMRKEMIKEMKYWVKAEDVDGFRCDVASGVPVDFWQQAIPQLRKVKPIFMLAEADQPDLFQDDLFDMGYGWKNYHMENEIAAGKKNAEDWNALQKQIDSIYEKNDIMMNFTSNHDENSWAGSVQERLGDGAETFAALSYMIAGMPLIYSGQEYDLKKRLRFFSKDTILHQKGKFYGLYEKLGKLKHENPALAGGKKPANYKQVENSTPKRVISFSRKGGGHQVLFIANVSSEEFKTTVNIQGEFRDFMRNKKLKLKKDMKIRLKPWEFLVLTH